MPPQPWPALLQPFDLHGATWWIQALTDEPGGAVLAPGVSATALRQRFDAVLGVDGWSFDLTPTPSGAIVCNLRLVGVGRGAVAERPSGVDISPSQLADRALALAAAAFGIGPSGEDRFSAVVDFDDEANAPLYLPEDELWLAAMAAAGATAGANAPNVEQRVAQSDASLSAPTDTPTLPLPVASRSDVSTAEQVIEAVLTPERSQGAQAIDKLVERLNEEGLGREAARLVVAHHGYGRNPAEGRELYSKLRALLLEKHGVDR